ncbi:Vms1/Ankzf1 family peptidyl-tRNA hydrolase [Streptomyces sp. KL116D]|uniref:baeRF2 domain-containing protein n=1 Tax=Streptomyces sp. KL116D TaxID=3045152 RepID=UPI003556439B
MDLAFLTPLTDRSGPWASVYIDTSRHSASTAQERSVEAAGVQRSLAAVGADEPTCRAVRAAVDDLQHTSEPMGRALFAAQGEVALDLPLSTAPVPSAGWGALPRTTPLLDLVGEDPLCLVAHVDRKGADLELHSARGDMTVGTVSGRQWPVHRTATADWSERHFQLRVENTWEHNAGEIAEAVADRQAETQAELVVLVGDDRECASVKDKLPGPLRDRTMRARHGAGSRLLGVELEQARAQHVARRVSHEMERYAEAFGRQEGAVAGVPGLVDAAREHRVEELLVRPEGPDPHREVWVGQSPDQVAVRRTDAIALGAKDPVSARADDALMRCAAASGAAALSVSAATPDSGPAGGLGALLRWTEPATDVAGS